MLKFLNADRFYKTLNQWVIDGSRITNIFTSQYSETATLIGADGCKEELTLFYEEENYNSSDLFVGDSEEN